MSSFQGSCHCGNVSVRFDSHYPLEELDVRVCACSFCRRHGARSITDPAGAVEFSVADADLLSRYRFATGSAEFLVCARSGVYAGALMLEGSRTVATLNLQMLDERDRFAAGRPVSYEGESGTDRRARRLRSWTPATLRAG